MCICINCKYVIKCSTYFLVETQHHQKHLGYLPSFKPISPIIQVNILEKYDQMYIDWDVIECLSFIEQPGNWINLSQ